MKIGGLQKTTLIDYPGKIACTVFLFGCNFRCPFCYSSELVLPEKIQNQPQIPEEDFFQFLEEKKGYLDGVVVCGGEPTINADLEEFLAKIKKKGFLIKLDTNGSKPEVLKKLIDKKLIDYVAMDIKAPLKKDLYEKAIGIQIDIDKIKESINLLKNSSIDYEFRTTVVPTIHQLEDIIEIANELKPAKKYYLQNFRPEKTLDPNLVSVKPYKKEELEKIIREIKKFFEDCGIRG